MKDTLLQVLPRIPPEPLRVYLYLLERSSKDIRVGLSQQEVSRATRLSVGAVREALGWLATPHFVDAGLVSGTEPEMNPYITLRKISNYYEIILTTPYGDGEKIKFTFEDTDSRRIETLEKEVRRIASKSVQQNRLSMYLKGERQQLIAEVEGDLGRSMTQQEVWLLSGIVHQFGPERVKKQWRQKAHQLDKPIIALYGMFMNKALGKSGDQLGDKVKEHEGEVQYRKVIRTDELV